MTTKLHYVPETNFGVSPRELDLAMEIDSNRVIQDTIIGTRENILTLNGVECAYCGASHTIEKNVDSGFGFVFGPLVDMPCCKCGEVSEVYLAPVTMKKDK